MQKNNIPGTPTSTNVFLRHFWFDMFKKSLLSLCLFLFLHLHSNVFSRKALICIFDVCLILQETNGAKEVKKRQISHRFPGNSDEGRHDTMTSFCQRKRNNNCEQHLVITVSGLLKNYAEKFAWKELHMYMIHKWFTNVHSDLCVTFGYTQMCASIHIQKKPNFTNVSIQTWCTHLKWIAIICVQLFKLELHKSNHFSF